MVGVYRRKRVAQKVERVRTRIYQNVVGRLGAARVLEVAQRFTLQRERYRKRKLSVVAQTGLPVRRQLVRPLYLRVFAVTAQPLPHLVHQLLDQYEAAFRLYERCLARLLFRAKLRLVKVVGQSVVGPCRLVATTKYKRRDCPCIVVRQKYE